MTKIATTKDIGINSNISIKIQDEKVNIISDILENKEDKKSQFNLNIKHNNEELIDGKLAQSNEKIYAFIKDITPNYYHTDFDYITLINGLSSNDYEKIFNLIKEAITNSISNSDIKKEKVTIKYKGKDKKVNKLIYTVTTKELEEFLTTLTKSIKSDKQLFNNIAKVLDKKTDELMQDMDDLIKSAHMEEEVELFNYQTYYYGFNKIVQYELCSKDLKSSIQYKVEDNNSTLNIIEDDSNVLSVEITNNKEQYTFTGTLHIDDENEIPFTGKYKDKELALEFDYDGKTIKAIINSDIKKLENSYIINRMIKLNTEKDGIDTEIATIECNNEYYFNKKVDLQLENSVDINEITIDDLQIILENLENNKLYQMLIGEIEKEDNIFNNLILDSYDTLIEFY